MFVTVYENTAKRRKGPDKGKVTTRVKAYSTKNDSEMHKHLREKCKGVSHKNVKRVYTHFCIGCPLDKPMVMGGELVK